MSSLIRPRSAKDSRHLRSACACVIALTVALATAGIILARQLGFPTGIALPVVAAFCLQGALYGLAVAGPTRRVLAAALPRAWLAASLICASVAPYIVYAVPTGVFDGSSLLALAVLCSVIVLPYVLAPVDRHRFSWQDAVVICAISFPMISGLSTMLRDTFQGFEPPAHRLDALGKLMLIPLGLFVFLEIRRLKGVGFHLLPRSRDWRPALGVATRALPLMLLVGLTTGYLRWDPPLEDPVGSLASAAGRLVGIYFTTALAEEVLMRGVLQNLAAASTARPRLSQAGVSLLFGAVHLGRGRFPNLPHAATATVLGWYCGTAYVESGTVTVAMMVHALAVAGQDLFFR